jgi:hypothetical protein
VLKHSSPTGAGFALAFYPQGSAEPLLMSIGPGIESSDMKGRTQPLPVSGAADISLLRPAADGGLILLVGRRWDEGMRRRVWVVDIGTQQVVASALFPQPALGVYVSPSGDSMLVDYGVRTAQFGETESVDLRRARAITGQSFTSTGLVPTP